MPTFSYIALKNNKDIVKGKVDALNVRAARDAVYAKRMDGEISGDLWKRRRYPKLLCPGQGKSDR